MNNTAQGGNKTRVLIVKLSSLGDLFHSLPAVRMLKTQLNATIDWVTQTEYAGLVKCFTDVDRVIAFPRRRKQGSRFRFLLDLRKFRYDYIIDLQGLMKSALIGRLARGARRIGPSYHREGAGMFYSSLAGEKNKNRHAVDENLDVIAHLGLEITAPEFPVVFPDLPVEHPSPRIALAPVTRWKTKCWPAVNFSSVGRMLSERIGASIYLLGSGEDTEVCRRIGEDIGGPVANLVGRSSLVELGSLISKMDAVVSNDSGPMHIAAAVGVPVVAVFGPTDPRRTGPFGQIERVLIGRRSCQPCMERTCRFGPAACMHEITPAMAADAVVRIVKGH